MSQPQRSVSMGSTLRLFDIPGAPTVGVTTLPSGAKRWTKLSDEIVMYYKQVAADAINDFADHVAHASLREVPKGPDPEHELADSIHYPGNDHSSKATPEYMVAWITYDAPYAGAQHEGMATMVHHHPIIPGQEGFFEDLRYDQEIVIEWKAEKYTTPGTKSHFLSDPYKAAIPNMEPYIYTRVRAAFAG